MRRGTFKGIAVRAAYVLLLLMQKLLNLGALDSLFNDFEKTISMTSVLLRLFHPRRSCGGAAHRKFSSQLA
jgi:hypothetical protein